MESHPTAPEAAESPGIKRALADAAPDCCSAKRPKLELSADSMLRSVQPNGQRQPLAPFVTTVRPPFDAVCRPPVVPNGLGDELGLPPSSERANTEKSTVLEPSGSNSQSCAEEPSTRVVSAIAGSPDAGSEAPGPSSGQAGAGEPPSGAQGSGEEASPGDVALGRRRSSRQSAGRQYMSLKELREERARQRKEAAAERRLLKAAVQEEKKRQRLAAAEERRRAKKEAEEERRRQRLAEREEKRRLKEAEAEEKRRLKARQGHRNNGARAAVVQALAQVLPRDHEEEEEAEEAWKKNTGLTLEDRARIPFAPMNANDRVCAWLFGKHFTPFEEPPTLSDDLLAAAGVQKAAAACQQLVANGP